MVTNGELRDQLRPQGLECPGCAGCHFRDQCGGYYNGRLFGNCFEELCCHFTGKDKTNCNAVCPYKRDFKGWLEDTRGLRFDDLPFIEQPPIELPTYIPLVDHRSSRRGPLAWPVVALKTYSVLGVRRGSGMYQAVADTPDALREAYRLTPEAQIVLRGVATDREVERYWEHRITADAPGQLARLRIHSAIGPNFSHFLDVPRTDHLYNKRRQLICLMELVRAGITVVPHLNSVSPGDWAFWRRYLEANATVRVVAIEFQTGHKSRCQGRRVLQHLAAMQQQLQRALHLVLVGGSQFIEYAAARFAGLSLIDSTPFHKTMHRFRFDASGPRAVWRDEFTLFGQKLDTLLAVNVAAYAAWVEKRVAQSRLEALIR